MCPSKPNGLISDLEEQYLRKISHELRLRLAVKVLQLLATIWLISPGVHAQSLEDGGRRGLVLGYVAGWVPAAEALAAIPHVDKLIFMDLQIQADGRVVNQYGWPKNWTELRVAAALNGVPFEVALTQFKTSDFNTLFRSEENIRKFQNELLRHASDVFVTGIHMDVELFESIDPAAVVRYRQFLVSIKRQLQSLSPPRTLSGFFFSGAGSTLYDADVLQVFDQIVVQGYDVHWLGGSSAGPVAPLMGPDRGNWNDGLSAIQALSVPTEKLVFGFPAYGYEWPVNPCLPRGARIGNGRITTYAQITLPGAPSIEFNAMDRVSKYGMHRDLETGSAYYQFGKQDDNCTVGWFEDKESLERKLDWLVEQKLGGLAVFPLGYDNGHLVQLAATKLRSAHSP